MEEQTAKVVQTPWGWWRVEAQGRGWKVKRLHVRRGHTTSLQFHRHRQELVVHPRTDEFWLIPKNKQHRIFGPADLVEFQWGVCRESDIVRLEDAYGRT